MQQQRQRRTKVCRMNESRNLGLRKGAWRAEEDELLRSCIENHGEGKWHQVPRKAGLNRCRKSCRLRWLNYLKPSIKRGEFEADEVDLILRLHRLLGNRWSLIAGRIPGRTANDVKNYWNSHIQKKNATTTTKAATVPNSEIDKQKLPSSTNIAIKPRARIFTKSLVPFFNDQGTIIPTDGNVANENPTDHHSTPTINYELWTPSDSCAESECKSKLIIMNNDGIGSSTTTADQNWWLDNLFVDAISVLPEIEVGVASSSSKELLRPTINPYQGPWFDQSIRFSGSTGNYLAAVAAGDQRCFQLEEGHEGNDHVHLGETSSDMHLWDFMS